MSSEILICLNRLGSGGAETQVRRVSVGLVERGWNVTIVSLLEDVIETPDLSNRKVQKINLNGKRGFKAALSFPALLSVIKKVNPDVILGMMIPADPLVRVAGKLLNTPVVSSIRNQYVGGNVVNKILRYTDPMTTVLTANAVITKNELGPVITKNLERIKIIPNLLDNSLKESDISGYKNIRSQLDIPEDDFIWLAVGSQRPQKNYIGLLKALGKTDSGYLAIAGADYQKEELTELAVRLHIEDRVKILGRRSDIPKLIKAADALILASHHEGTPNSVLEAMQLGLPVLATSVGDIPYIIKNGTTGWTVPPNNTEILENKMSFILSLEKSKLLEIGELGKKSILKRHDKEEILKKWECILNDAMNK